MSREQPSHHPWEVARSTIRPAAAGCHSGRCNGNRPLRAEYLGEHKPSFPRVCQPRLCIPCLRASFPLLTVTRAVLFIRHSSLPDAPPPSPGCRRLTCCTSAGRGPSCGRGTAACRPNPRTTGSAENPDCRSSPPPLRRSGEVAPLDSPSGELCAATSGDRFPRHAKRSPPVEGIILGQQFVERGESGRGRAERFSRPRGDELSKPSPEFPCLPGDVVERSPSQSLMLAAAAGSIDPACSSQSTRSFPSASHSTRAPPGVGGRIEEVERQVFANEESGRPGWKSLDVSRSKAIVQL